MKIVEIAATNFKGIERVKVELSDGHTNIVGLNGSGKTSLFNIIQACINGVSQKGSKGELVGERFRFIGPHKKTADLKITLRDEAGGFDVVITNKMTKASNGIEFKASNGRTLDRQWLNDFFNVAFLSAKNFIERTPKEQALLLGINTSEFDAEIKELKKTYSIINAAIKDFGAVEEVEKVARVDGYALVQEKERVEKHNREQGDKVVDIEKRQGEIAVLVEDLEDLMDKVKLAHEQIDLCQRVLKDMPLPDSIKSTESITEQIKNVDAINRAAEAYERNEERRIAKDKKVKEIAQNKIEQSKINDKRTDYIKNFDFKNDGLSVDEEGGLLLNDMRLSEFSTGEQIIIVHNLYASKNPKLKTVLIDGFEVLDEPNQQKIVDGLINKGIQVITLEVGDKKKDKDTILLRECKVVDEEQENKPVKPKLL